MLPLCGLPAAIFCSATCCAAACVFTGCPPVSMWSDTAKSSTSCVKNSLADVALIVPEILQRLYAIFKMVLTASKISGLSLRPVSCPSMAASPSWNTVPHPSVLRQQYQPPSRPLRMLSLPQFGHVRSALRQRYLPELWQGQHPQGP